MHDLIGIIAAILTTASFVPQAIMVVRTRDTAGISLVMYVMFTIGVAGWTSYGLMIGSVPVIAA
ncbi:MAG: SemiSWEET family transporter, partial [Pseudomonadota bacterium]